jgi:hypothetical protein
MQALETTAATRVKAFLIDRIGGIRPGGAALGGGGARNATMRRQGLLAFREYPAFLSNHATAAYTEVMHRYIDDNRLYLASTVKAYMSGLAMVTQRRERTLLVSPSDMTGRGFNSRLGSIFLPSVLLPNSLHSSIKLSKPRLYGYLTSDAFVFSPTIGNFSTVPTCRLGFASLKHGNAKRLDKYRASHAQSKIAPLAGVCKFQAK